MHITDADRKTIAEWLTNKCGNLRCMCCGNQTWSVLESAGIWIGFNTHTTRFHYHDGVPVVCLLCTNCGHLVPFSAQVMGLRPDPPAAVLPEADPSGAAPAQAAAVAPAAK